MKSKVFGVGIGSSVFILMIVTVLAVVRPIYVRMSDFARNIEKSFILKLEDETGLSVSYDSLSPALFSAIKLNRISFCESSSSKKLLGIKSAVFSFSFFKLISGDKLSSFDKLSLNGIEFEYDAAKDSEIFQNISRLVKKNPSRKASGNNKIDAADEGIFSLEGRTVDLPFDIIIKNLSVHYSDLQNDLTLLLKKLEMKDYFMSEGLSIKTSGRFSYQGEKIKIEKRRAKIAGNFSVAGTLYNVLEGSSALISFSGSSGADYSLSHLDVLVNYSSDTVELRTMRTVLPFSVFAQADLQNQSLSCFGNFEKFDPFSLVTVRNKTPVMKKILGSTLSGTVSAQIGKNSASYDTDLRLALSKNIAGEAIAGRVKFNGDKENVKIDRIAVESSSLNADFTGSYNIQNIQPSGVLSLNNLTLKNGGIVSTEVYVDPKEKGFMCFAPQFFMNEKSFTAIQIDVLPERGSWDFSFEMYDYAHADFEQAGRVFIEGSFLTGKEKFLQAQVQISNVFADSVMQTGAFFANTSQTNTLSNISKSFAPYIFTSEFYFSTDFKNISCNAPYGLIANTRKERELVVFSMDGSNQTFQLTQLEIQFGNNVAHAQASIDFVNGLKEFSLVSNMTVNSIPYRLSGNFTPEWISFSGDYGFDAVVFVGEELNGSIQFSNLPFAIGKSIFSASTNCSFVFNEVEGIAAQVYSFEIDHPSSRFAVSPHFVVSGSVNNYGFLISDFAYTDDSSSLNGDGSILWNINNGIFDSVRISVQGASPVSAEKLRIAADITNPNMLPFSADALTNEFYFSCDASVVAFPVSRFIEAQSPENTISADLAASGTIKNPFVSVSLRQGTVALAGYPLVAHGEFVFDDVGMSLSEVDCNWRGMHLSNGQVIFDPASFSGESTALLDGSVFGKSVKIPLSIKLSGEIPQTAFSIPDFYTAEISTAGISGEFFRENIPYSFSVVHTPGRFDFLTDDDEKFRASYTDSGELFIYAGSKMFASFTAEGTIKDKKVDLAINSIHCDLHDVSSRIDFPTITFSSGILSGNLAFSGMTADPEITGDLRLDSPSCNIPVLSKSNIHVGRLNAKIIQNELIVPKTLLYLGKAAAYANVNMEISRLRFTTLDANLKSSGKRGLPFDMTFPIIHAKGEANVDLNFQMDFPRDLEVKGDFEANNAEVEIVLSSVQKQFSANTFSFFTRESEKSESPVDVVAEMNFKIGQKVQCMFNPLIRGVVTPGTEVSFFIDTVAGDYAVNGDISLRGGEIAWVNRNFYMKEGKVILNESDDKNFDPRLTVFAETRERDDDGNIVTISLTARNQFFSMFNPIFTATPMKSEKEILQLLGQIVTSDSDSLATIAVAGGDYLVQTTVMRKIENTLRELTNFDIFSIRTNVLQNSVKLRMNRNSTSKHAALGNFIDNSSVYVGKYFGSSLYVDTLLHWSYDDTKDNDGKSVRGIVFQPEFGLEMASPYVNIRLGIAPNIESIQNGFQRTIVPSTFMTLSWKYSF